MTPYEQGFLTKCAERGIDGRSMLKQALFGFGKKPTYLDDVDHISGVTGYEVLGKNHPYSGLAESLSKAVRPGTMGQLLLTLDDKNPNLLTEYTVASDAPDSWSDADEWKLIGQGYKEMRKRKVKRLLMAITNEGHSNYPYRVWTGDVVAPKSRFRDGKHDYDISSLFWNGDPIQVG